MPSNDLCFLGACEQEQLIRSKKISVTQLITPILIKLSALIQHSMRLLP